MDLTPGPRASRRRADNSLSLNVLAAVRTQRTARGWTQQELADRCTATGFPVVRNLVAMWETGRRLDVTVDQLYALARAFGVPVDDLVHHTCSNCNGAPPSGFVCGSCGRHE